MKDQNLTPHQIALQTIAMLAEKGENAFSDYTPEEIQQIKAEFAIAWKELQQPKPKVVASIAFAYAAIGTDGSEPQMTFSSVDRLYEYYAKDQLKWSKAVVPKKYFKSQIRACADNIKAGKWTYLYAGCKTIDIEYQDNSYCFMIFKLA